MPAELLQLARRSTRDVQVGESPALLAVDLYERVYRGGALPIGEVTKAFPNACGEMAWSAIPRQCVCSRLRVGGVAHFVYNG